MDIAFDLTPLVAAKLIIYSLGALVHLFLMVLILGQRRLRSLEWLLFALVSAIFMWNSGNLLALNIALAYGTAQKSLFAVAATIAFAGVVAAPPLMVHSHAEYLSRFRPLGWPWRLLVAGFYLPLVQVPWMVGNLLRRLPGDPIASLRPDLPLLAGWMVGALVLSAGFDFALRKRPAAGPHDARFHGWLALVELLLAGGGVWAYWVSPGSQGGLGDPFPTALALAAIVPGLLVGYSTLKYNLFDLRMQRNLVYSIVAIFALLIYIDFIRRMSTFLDDHHLLPAAVTEGLMIFCLVVFLEPVKKAINRALQAAVQSEVERVQKLATEIQEFAKKSGDLGELTRFVEEKVPLALGLERVSLALGRPRRDGPPAHPASEARRTRALAIHRGAQVIGQLEVVAAAPGLSGEQVAALQLLADQLAAAIEVCQLIADKVRLERELAEKAKMAFLGEMAARIAHNVKNPLSAMKTIVQLLEEDSSLPERARQDCRLVAAEIDRLNANISQVLRYAKPARDTDRPADLVAVVSRVLALARADAERRKVSLELEGGAECPIAGGEEAVGDIVSNLVVNALEASPPGGQVRLRVVGAQCSIGQVGLSVEDEGPGIPAELQEKVFEPFFTTRPGGTGLGLAIVARRVEEIGGSVHCVSPIEGGKGTKFSVRFRSA
ncbi:MAG TPA: ATP-binding protein [Terriglobia bacterium]|nr:ATP-binding protein [Terriglobia bacterium]